MNLQFNLIKEIKAKTSEFLIFFENWLRNECVLSLRIFLENSEVRGKLSVVQKALIIIENIIPYGFLIKNLMATSQELQKIVNKRNFTQKVTIFFNIAD